jgi:hypothetical protein
MGFLSIQRWPLLSQLKGKQKLVEEKMGMRLKHSSGFSVDTPVATCKIVGNCHECGCGVDLATHNSQLNIQKYT